MSHRFNLKIRWNVWQILEASLVRNANYARVGINQRKAFGLIHTEVKRPRQQPQRWHKLNTGKVQSLATIIHYHEKLPLFAPCAFSICARHCRIKRKTRRKIRR